MNPIDITKQVNDAILEIIKVEGKVKSVTKYGNCFSIIFENGNTYKQPLIEKYSVKVTLD